MLCNSCCRNCIRRRQRQFESNMYAAGAASEAQPQHRGPVHSSLSYSNGRNRKVGVAKQRLMSIPTSSVACASGGFRAAYQALPRSLVEQLDALAGGRHPARIGHWHHSFIPDVHSTRSPGSRHWIGAINLFACSSVVPRSANGSALSSFGTRPFIGRIFRCDQSFASFGRLCQV